MKLAILLHGHMRSYEKTFSSYKKVVKKLKKQFDTCDVFLHTWDTKEPNTRTWYPIPPDANGDVDEQEIKSMYAPTKMLMERQDIKEPNKTLFGICYEGLKYSAYSAYAANQLKEEHEKENNFTYDIVIKMRPDVEFYSDFFIDELKESDCIWICQQFTKRSAIDVIVFSNSEAMNKICDYYKEFDSLMNNLDNISDEISGRNNEAVFDYYLNSLPETKKVSKYVMPRDWRLFRSWWPRNHQVGHRKWDRLLAIKEINQYKKYKYFRIKK